MEVEDGLDWGFEGHKGIEHRVVKDNANEQSSSSEWLRCEKMSSP